MNAKSGDGAKLVVQDRPPVRLQRQTMASQVADELRRRILTGEIAEGTQLMQEQLATEFGISKVPIREALFLLEAEGLVIQQFHRGAVVSGLSPAQLMELFELRTQIEMWLLQLAMPVADEDAVRNAKMMADSFENTDDPVTAWNMNWGFHEALYQPAQKPHVLSHLRKLHSQTARYIRQQYSLAVDKKKIVSEHMEILDHYARKDSKTVELLKYHIINAAEQLTKRMTQLNQEEPQAPGF